MLLKPKFYDSFVCTADKCPDTCCVGWEIDVDDDTAAYYSLLPGEDGDFIRSRLIYDSDGQIQLCREGERCRFLRSDNLCELIIKHGDSALCDICREHPRFYSGTDRITVTGIGLCCPEAAEMWLNTSWDIIMEDDGINPSESEKTQLARMLCLINTVMDEKESLTNILSVFPTGSDSDCTDFYLELRSLYSSLEALDPKFSECFGMTAPNIDDERYRRLAIYYIFRYFFELGEDLCLRFTAASLIMTAAIGGNTIEAAKNYSKEVEYDPDNLERIYSFICGRDKIFTLLRRVIGD